MLPTIIFGLALFCSIMFTIIIINKLMTSIKRGNRQDIGSVGYFYFIGTIVLWAYLYWLTH